MPDQMTLFPMETLQYDMWMLHDHPEFDLTTVHLIDRVQKHAPLNKDEVKYLRRLKVVEGKMPYIYVSAKVAESLDQKEQYIVNKGFEDEAYKKWIVNYLETYKKGKRQDFIKLLDNKLPDTMNEEQKVWKVKNLLHSLKRDGIITTDSPNRRLANWILVKDDNQ
ncbi:MAG: hypothetical protein LUE24_15200 [Lachnospiraceae bacterium]|nr:hypothetical protein [Lachnospiraceae bacterium]